MSARRVTRAVMRGSYAQHKWQEPNGEAERHEGGVVLRKVQLAVCMRVRPQALFVDPVKGPPSDENDDGRQDVHHHAAAVAARKAVQQVPIAPLGSKVAACRNQKAQQDAEYRDGNQHRVSCANVHNLNHTGRNHKQLNRARARAGREDEGARSNARRANGPHTAITVETMRTRRASFAVPSSSSVIPHTTLSG